MYRFVGSLVCELFWSIVLTALFIVTIGLIKNLYLQIPDVSWEMILQASRLRMAFVVTCNIALLLIIFLTTRLMQQRETLSWLAVTVFALLIAVQLLTAELLFTISIHETQNDDLFIYVDLCLLISSVISFPCLNFFLPPQRSAIGRNQNCGACKHRSITPQNYEACIQQCLNSSII